MPIPDTISHSDDLIQIYVHGWNDAEAGLSHDNNLYSGQLARGAWDRGWNDYNVSILTQYVNQSY